MKDNAINKLYRLSWILYLIYLIEHPLISNRKVDVVVMILLTLSFFYGCVLNIKAFNFREFASFIIILCIIVTSILYTSQAITVTLIKAVFLFFVNYLSVVLLSKSTITKKTYDFVFSCTILASLLFIVYYFSPIAFIITDDNGKRIVNDFTCNLNNSNYTAIVLFVLFSILLINLKTRKRKIGIVILLASLFYLIIQTAARSCLISVIVMILCYILQSIKQKKSIFKISKSVVVIVSLLPLLFVGVYLWMFYNLDKNIVILNKPLFSGREEVYVEYIGKISDLIELLIGNITAAQFQNAHNGPLSIFVSIGLFGLIITYFLLLTSMFRVYKRNTMCAFFCLISIFCMLFQCCAESALMVGGVTSLVGFCGVFFLSSYDVNCIHISRKYYENWIDDCGLRKYNLKSDGHRLV